MVLRFGGSWSLLLFNRDSFFTMDFNFKIDSFLELLNCLDYMKN